MANKPGVSGFIAALEPLLQLGPNHAVPKAVVAATLETLGLLLKCGVPIEPSWEPIVKRQWEMVNEIATWARFE